MNHFVPAPLARCVLLVVLAVTASGCVASRVSPDGVIPDSNGIAVHPLGAWIQVDMLDRARISGELMAISADTVHVLTPYNELRAVPRVEIEAARLEAYRNNWKDTANWAGAGALSTFSHGLLLPLSATVWGLLGSAASVEVSKLGFYEFDGRAEDWAQAARYARFPMGMPAGLDTAGLRFIYTHTMSR